MTLTSKLSLNFSNDVALVDQALADPAAFAALYDLYFTKVYNYARYRVLDRVIADDLTAEIFEKTLVKLHTYQPEKGPFSAWLFTIARNTVNHNLRKQRLRQWFSLEDLPEFDGQAPSPDEIVVQDETRRTLLGALSQLNARERELIALKFSAGLTNRTIAEMTGLKENHVATILHRALQRMRLQMESNGA